MGQGRLHSPGNTFQVDDQVLAGAPLHNVAHAQISVDEPFGMQDLSCSAAGHRQPMQILIQVTAGLECTGSGRSRIRAGL